jgi:zinc protease
LFALSQIKRASSRLAIDALEREDARHPTMFAPLALLAYIAAAPLPPMFPSSIDKLPNGLTVVTVPVHTGSAVAFYTLVRAGSRDEVEPGKSGYAHLFEHLMFRGTEKVPARQYDERMQALGSDNNAFTTDDFTLYIPVIPKESLSELVELEADRFQRLSFTDGQYKDETGAVLGEYNKNFSNPSWAIDEAIRELAFKKHTYGHTTIGYKRDVDAMPGAYAYSRQFFKRFYTPDDCTIFVVGDVDRQKVLDQVTTAYAGWQGKRAETKVVAEPEQKEARRRDITWKMPTAPRLAIGWRIPAASTSMRDTATLSVIAGLAFSEPSALYQRLVVKEQRVLELSSDPDDVLHRDPGLFRVDAKLKQGESFDGILEAIQSTLDLLAQGNVDLAELEATKQHLRNRLVLEMQTPNAIAIRLAFMTATFGDPRALDAYISELTRVTKEDVARVAKANVAPTRRTTITLSPPGTK